MAAYYLVQKGLLSSSKIFFCEKRYRSRLTLPEI